LSEMDSYCRAGPTYIMQFNYKRTGHFQMAVDAMTVMKLTGAINMLGFLLNFITERKSETFTRRL